MKQKIQKRIQIYDVAKHFILILVSVVSIIPFILLIIASFSSEQSIVKNGYTFFPSEWSLDAYQYIVREGAQILRAYLVTITVTVVGTVSSLLLTTLMAYPLSRKDLPGRAIFGFLLFFTMLFNGGLVPSYIMWTKYLGISNTLAALILPNLLLNAFYVIMTRSYYQSNIPSALIEAAQIDGASEFQIYYKLVLPLSKPILATVALFVGLSYWNDWNNGLLYVSDDSLNSIQMLLNKMMANIQFMSNNSSLASQFIGQLPSSTVRMAIAVIGVLPILVIYPFIQRFFVKGIVVGAVKG